jgi:hypothetical protein
MLRSTVGLLTLGELTVPSRRYRSGFCIESAVLQRTMCITPNILESRVISERFTINQDSYVLLKVEGVLYFNRC